MTWLEEKRADRENKEDRRIVNGGFQLTIWITQSTVRCPVETMCGWECQHEHLEQALVRWKAIDDISITRFRFHSHLHSSSRSRVSRVV